jgi:Isochorismatase family
MKITRRLCLGTAAAVSGLALIAVAAPQARADIISDWGKAMAPPIPELKPVTLEGRTTALLILDLMKEGCHRRPTCVAMVPKVKKLHDAARASGAMVFYTLVGGPNPTAADVVPEVTPKDGEWVVQRGPDKFLGSPLEQG